MEIYNNMSLLELEKKLVQWGRRSFEAARFMKGFINRGFHRLTI